MNEAADSRLSIHACGALALMSGRYWTTAAAHTRRQLQRWRAVAEVIPDLDLRELALGKLTEERANAYFAATFATLAPRRQRPTTIEAIVALQVIYDYLDGLTEQPAPRPLCRGLELFRALSDAVCPSLEPHDNYYRHDPQRQDGGYLSRLVAAARGALTRLPAIAAVTDMAGAAAARCAQAQVRAHSAALLGTTQLQQWASGQAAHDEVSWGEFLAAAASAIISIHALVAAAAEPCTTPEQAARVDTFHRRSTCAVATILDGFADRRRDEASAENDVGYLRYFPQGAPLSEALVEMARRARREATRMPHGGHHLMTLGGVVSYYTSALGRSDSSSRAIVAPLRQELKPLITPTLAFMRAWRLGQHVCRCPRKRSSQPGREAATGALDARGSRPEH